MGSDAPERPFPWARLGLLAGGAALLGATLFLARPEGVRAVASSLGAWVDLARAGAYPIAHPWLRMVVDAPLLALLGWIGVALVALRMVRSGGEPSSAAEEAGPPAAPMPEAGATDALDRFLLLWIFWAILLLIAPWRTPETLPLFGVALAFCAAAGIGAVLPRRLANLPEWREAALVAAVLTVILLSQLFLAVSIVSAPTIPGNELVVLLALGGLVVLLVAGYAWYVSPNGALLVALGVASLFLAGASLASLSDLAFRHDERHPNGLVADFALTSAANLGEDVTRLSAFRSGNSSQLPVVVVNGPNRVPDPQIGWQIRTMRNVTWSAAPPAPIDPALAALMPDEAPRPLVIMPPESTTGVGGALWDSSYLGSDFPMRSRWLPSDLPRPTGETWQERWQNGLRPWLRWLIYRDALPPPAVLTTLWAAAE
jgi:hypothetical protein